MESRLQTHQKRQPRTSESEQIGVQERGTNRFNRPTRIGQCQLCFEVQSLQKLARCLRSINIHQPSWTWSYSPTERTWPWPHVLGATAAPPLPISSSEFLPQLRWDDIREINKHQLYKGILKWVVQGGAPPVMWMLVCNPIEAGSIYPDSPKVKFELRSST